MVVLDAQDDWRFAGNVSVDALEGLGYCTQTAVAPCHGPSTHSILCWLSSKDTGWL